MKNYKFPVQGIELNNAFIEDVQSVFTVNKNRKLIVNAVINSNGEIYKDIYLGTMDDKAEWTDKNIIEFAEAELKKCEV